MRSVAAKWLQQRATRSTGAVAGPVGPACWSTFRPSKASDQAAAPSAAAPIQGSSFLAHQQPLAAAGLERLARQRALGVAPRVGARQRAGLPARPPRVERHRRPCSPERADSGSSGRLSGAAYLPVNLAGHAQPPAQPTALQPPTAQKLPSERRHKPKGNMRTLCAARAALRLVLPPGAHLPLQLLHRRGQRPPRLLLCGQFPAGGGMRAGVRVGHSGGRRVNKGFLQRARRQM